MNRQNSDLRNASTETVRWSLPTRLLISAAILFHFGVLSLTYFANNSLRRPVFADRLLIQLQPYLITMGWYSELAPVALVTDDPYDRSMKIEYISARADTKWADTKWADTRWADTKWTEWLDSARADARWRRMVVLAGALVANEDTDGMGLLAHAIVARAAKDGIAMDRIRFASTDDAGVEQPMYEAKIIRLDGKEVTLVPSIEPTRTVPVVSAASPSAGRE